MNATMMFRDIYAFHKKYEPYFGRYSSRAEIAVVAPGSWPSGEAAQEYRGVQLMLKESHVQYDIIEDSQVGVLGDQLSKYKVIILPEITKLDAKSISTLKNVVRNGTHLIATNRTLTNDTVALSELFGARVVKKDYDGAGHYLDPDNKTLFTRFDKQSLLFWKFNLGLYDFSKADTAFLPILTPGRPGPPEIIGGHEPMGYYAVGMKDHGASKGIVLPINLGKLYYLHGYEQHKNILLDILEYAYPEVFKQVETNAHPRVEVIVQNFIKNIPENLSRKDEDGFIVHLVNLTGFSGNTYFEPLPVEGIEFRIRSEFKPARMFTLTQAAPVDFRWNDGYITFTLGYLGQFESIVVEKE